MLTFLGATFPKPFRLDTSFAILQRLHCYLTAYARTVLDDGSCRPGPNWSGEPSTVTFGEVNQGSTAHVMP